MTRLFSALQWRAMSQEARDLGLNNAPLRPAAWRWSPAAALRRDAQAFPRASRPAIWPARAQPDRSLQAGEQALTLLFIHAGDPQTRAKVFQAFAGARSRMASMSR